MSEKVSIQELKRQIKELERELAYRDWKEKAIKEREELFASIVESAKHGILIYEELKPLFLNQAFADLLGYTPHEILAMETILPLLDKREHHRLSAYTYARLRKGKWPIHNELLAVRKDGKRIRVVCGIAGATWEGTPAIQMTVFPITEKQKKKMEQKASALPIAAGKAELISDDEAAEPIPEGAEVKETTGDMIRNIPIGVFRFQPGDGGKYLMANPAFLEMFGIESEQALLEEDPSNLFMILDDREYLTNKLLQEGTVNGLGIWMKKRDNTPVWGLINGRVQYNEGEETVAYIDCTVTDFTERKQADEALAESERRFRNLIEDSLQGILIHRDLKPLFVNQAYADIYGYTTEEILEMDSILKLFAAHEQDRIIGYNKDRKAGGNVPVQYEYQGVRVDGSMIWLENWVAETRWSGEPAIQEAIYDISYRKRSEQALRKAKNDLETANKQLEEANAKATEMANLAERANRAKSDFMESLGHQFRKPVNAVVETGELLRNTSLDPKQMGFTETIEKNAESLLELIDDVLDFSKIATGDMNLDTMEFDVKTTVEQLAEQLSKKAHEKQLEFACLVHHDIPSPVCGDPWRLRQILTHLTDNAIKFTERGEVLIRVRLDAETDTTAKIRFSVSDTGIGIEHERLVDLFDTFNGRNDDSAIENRNGFGLGLAISKRLVEMMKGTLSVESEPGKGSNFQFVIPFEKKTESMTAPTVVPPDIHEKRILVVEADNSSREVILTYLNPWKCEYSVASSEKETLRILKNGVQEQKPYHVALIGHTPPKLDGERLGREIKADPELQNTAMIYTTARGERGDAQRAREIGFSAYFVKPIKSSELYDCLLLVLGDSPLRGSNDEPVLVTRHTLAEFRNVIH
jgi:PAS domain S-box-containing protein